MARAGKNSHSKMGSSFRRWNSGQMLLAFLLLFSMALLVLLSLGILSLNSAAPKTPHDVSDLTSLKFQTDLQSRQESELENERKQWTEVLSWEPRAFVYHNFLTDDECDYLVNLAKPHMRKSTVVDSATGKSKDSRVRTSSGTFLQRGQDKVIRNVEKRIADFTFIPVGMFFGPNMEKGFKFFITRLDRNMNLILTTSSMNSTPRMVAKGSQLFLCTCMKLRIDVHLTDVEEGGETVFPSVKVNSSSIPYWDELSECGKTGLSVRPKKGDALLFWSMKPDATLDPLSLHSGCPVIKGNKWSSTKWMRINEYRV
ncbi:putative prolyl 4-hydroxylase 3 [Nymphaea thermarum]|nr:putative prolyl 4-hydroxylase 3 [Nymphaea thermarum]